jgi:uncharacterized protein (DUF3084 family)
MASLQEEYSLLEDRLRSLEKQQSQYFTEFKELEAQNKNLQLGFVKCTNQGVWRVLFESRRVSAEEERKKLETERKSLFEFRGQIEKKRRELNALRREIERTHLEKGPNSPYEIAFRTYMDQMQTDYLDRVEYELFYGYDQYKIGIQAYHEIVKSAIDMCEKGRVDKLMLENATELIKTISTAVEVIRKILGK